MPLQRLLPLKRLPLHLLPLKHLPLPPPMLLLPLAMPLLLRVMPPLALLPPPPMLPVLLRRLWTPLPRPLPTPLLLPLLPQPSKQGALDTGRALGRGPVHRRKALCPPGGHRAFFILGCHGAWTSSQSVPWAGCAMPMSGALQFSACASRV